MTSHGATLREAANPIAAIPEPKITTVAQALLSANVSAQIRKALPSGINSERFMRTAMTAMKTNPKLAKAEVHSFLGALLSCAQVGLEIGGPLGRAWLVPFENKRKGIIEVQLMLGYRGMIELSYRSGEIAYFDAQIIRAHDEFDYAYGTKAFLVHRPAYKERGAIVGAYVVVTFKDGNKRFEVLTVEEIEEHRARSKAAGDGPWVSDWEAMALKTVLRKMWVWLPSSSEAQQLMQMDALADAGLSQGHEFPGEFAVIDEATGEVLTEPLTEAPSSPGDAPPDPQGSDSAAPTLQDAIAAAKRGEHDLALDIARSLSPPDRAKLNAFLTGVK